MHVTAPMRGLTRLAPAYRAGIVLKVTAHSACWRIASHRDSPDRSATWSGLSWRSSEPRAWKRQPTAYARTTSLFRGRFVGRSAASGGSIWRSGSCATSSRNAFAVASRPSPRFANGSVWSGSFRTRGKWPTSTSVCCRRRLVLRPLVQPAITADEFNMTRGQTRRRISVKFSSIVFP